MPVVHCYHSEGRGLIWSSSGFETGSHSCPYPSKKHIDMVLSYSNEVSQRHSSTIKQQYNVKEKYSLFLSFEDCGRLLIYCLAVPSIGCIALGEAFLETKWLSSVNHSSLPQVWERDEWQNITPRFPENAGGGYKVGIRHG